ncbi:Hvo_1808 family surface protein [Halosegnis sp.]|uniref:Hvo_1808 family surface protein n=1 Tax=Halosegnis sp. TaxID=2864959 RepID=UPI0035D508F2
MRATAQGAVVVASVLGLVLAGVAPAAGAAATTPTPEQVTERTGAVGASENAPPDPETDQLGWEAGYWYNETLPVTTDDGLNRTELRAYVARTAARVERIRQLEFERIPTVNLVTRDEYTASIDRRFANVSVSTPQRLHQNTKFEALFFVGEQESYFQVQRQNQAGSVAAFYARQPLPRVGVGEGEIAIITGDTSENTTQVFSPSLLAHELTHAAQGQNFPTALNVTGDTEEATRANLSLIEGDAEYVEQTYNQRCGTAFDCLSANSTGGAGNIANWGLAIYGLAAYGNTGAFVGHIIETRGYETLNGFYRGEDRPVSTEQYIHPDRYPDDTPQTVTVEDRSNEEWNVLELPNSTVEHATFGEAGVFSMLWYPTRQRGEEVIVPLINETSNPLVGFNFAREPSTGWDGDKLYPYVNESSAATNETGYVWKLVWDSPEDAREFADAYRQLLEFYGAQPARGADDAYVISPEGFGPGTKFADAFALTVEDDTVVIVNAPTLSDLNEVRAGTVPEDARPPTPTPSALDTETPTPTASPTPTPTETDAATATPGQPGLGVVTALVALVLALTALVAGRWR